jgi:colicin import membrane protein
MQAAARLPRIEGEGVSKGLLPALFCHGLLFWALAVGVNWRSSDEGAVAEAELWAAVPQAAAPRAVEPPPPPPEPEVDRRAEQQRAEAQQQRLEAEIAERREREKKQRDKKLQEQRDAEEKRREQQKTLEAERRDKQAAERKTKAEEARREAQRQENLRRIQGLAGASGGPTATGTALQSAGPSAAYAGRIKARIKPNITLTETLAGNPLAEVEVRTAPDGLILSRRLVKASGNAQWDEAVLRAIDKTERLPRDSDGRVPPLLVITFRPND